MEMKEYPAFSKPSPSDCLVSWTLVGGGDITPLQRCSLSFLQPQPTGLGTQLLPSSGHVDTVIWMHYLDTNKTAGEKARQQLHKNAASNIANKSWRQHPRKHQQYDNLPPITKTIQVR